MELTKEYFDDKLSQLVTKEDAKSFAVKNDLLELATKDALFGMATKDDLLGLATKDDLLELASKNELGSLRSEIAEIKQLVRRIDEREDQDTRAVLRDIVDLNRRVSALESPAGAQ